MAAPALLTALFGKETLMIVKVTLTHVDATGQLDPLLTITLTNAVLASSSAYNDGDSRYQDFAFVHQKIAVTYVKTGATANGAA